MTRMKILGEKNQLSYTRSYAPANNTEKHADQCTAATVCLFFFFISKESCLSLRTWICTKQAKTDKVTDWMRKRRMHGHDKGWQDSQNNARLQTNYRWTLLTAEWSHWNMPLLCISVCCRAVLRACWTEYSGGKTVRYFHTASLSSTTLISAEGISLSARTPQNAP